GAHVGWRGSVFVLIGALLLAGAIALGGGGTLLAWGVGGLARWPLRVAAVTGLYLAPGLALLRLLWPREHTLSPIMQLALAPGFSVALPPLLLLLFQQIGLPWGAAATWAYLLLSLISLFGFWILDFRLSSASKIQNPKSKISLDEVTPALVGVILAALLVRLYGVRDLPVGLWGDSYHHTLIAQLLIDHQGIFQSWQPYAPLATFTYHFGFHANVAFVH